ncbi:MAG TPA: GAF domain-containing protein [Vicinamibacteria bacterium]|nr:GAF domain-containing protein [Vicinamibacteria bacterium]
MSAQRETTAPPDTRRLEALQGVAASIGHSPDLGGVLSAGLDAAVAALGVEMGGIYLVEGDEEELRLTPYQHGLPIGYAEQIARFRRGEALVGRALRGSAPLVIPDLSSATEARDATRQLGIKTALLVPLFAQGRAVGVMALGGRTPRDVHAEELRFLEALGGMLGSAVENARLMRRTQRHLDEVKAVWEIDRAIVEERELHEVLSIIAVEAAVLGGGDSVILLQEPDGELRVAGAHGHGARRAIGEPPSLGGSPVARLLALPGPSAMSIEAGGAARAYVVPMRAGERGLGGLVVVKPEDQASSDDLTLLSTFAHQAAVALAKARVREAERRRAGQLALVSAASEIAVSTLDVDELLGAIARYVQRSFHYYAVALYLAMPEEREARLTGAAGAATLLPKNHRVKYGAGIVGWVVERGEYVLANDVNREARFTRSAMEATRAELAVPVRLSGEVVAVINVLSDRASAFDEGDLVAIDAIAAQVASAIRNARVFADKLRALRNLEVVQDITNVLNSDLDLDALLERIARRSVEAVRPAQMGAVLLYDGEALRVRSSHGYPRPAALADVCLAFHEGLPGSVFVSGLGHVTTPPDHGGAKAAFLEAAGDASIRSALAVPIALPQEKLGVLLLENTREAAAFDAEDLRFATTLAHQAAIAIGNALRLRKILELDQQRQAYLSNVSHELRTPLTVIQGYLEALESGAAGDKAAHFLRVSREQAARLGRLIDEVLEVSRLERGVAQTHLEWEPVSLPGVVRGVLQALRQDIVLKTLHVVETLPEGLLTVPGDERLLRLLVFNVVENAVKFTPPGGRIVVDLGVGDGNAVLSVTDNGIGIPRDDRERVFEKFFTVDSGVNRAHGGTGIGLYLAREVVLIHAGAIAASEAPSGGTRIEIRLPLRPER